MLISLPEPQEFGELRNSFLNALPFPYLVADDFLQDSEILSKSFPEIGWNGWHALGDTYQHNKFTCSNPDLFPKELSEIIDELSSPRFLNFLEKVTGIEKLIPDPYLEGGGLHLSTGGGILSPHTDFHIYERLGLYRRINLILYLNENWVVGDGGELELSVPGDLTPIALVEPMQGRIVLFQTDDLSVHGFRNPVRLGTERRSIALYYYTSEETSIFSGDQTTRWRDHGTIKSFSKFRFLLYKILLRISRAFSIVAQIINPNQGIGLVKSRLHQRNKS